MTLAEFHAVARGFARSRGATTDDASDEAEYHEALAAFRKAGLA
jgi:hypothetical protein